MEKQNSSEQQELLERLVKFANLYVQMQNRSYEIAEGVFLTIAEVQTLEYLLANDSRHEKMADIAVRLGVTPSTLSQNVKKMVKMGLLEKYHTATNRKNIIVRVSKRGKEVYDLYRNWINRQQFDPFFAVLDEIPPEYIRTMCRALDILNTPVKDKHGEASDELIPVE